jgi:hypothetical protein
MRGRLIKGALTVFGAVLFSTLGIFASDTIRGIDGMSNIAGVSGRSGVCKQGALPLNGPRGVVCVDVYEASPSSGCPFTATVNVLQSEQNVNTKDCFAVSVKGATPWSFVSLPQAQRACATSGKRLPTSEEWYRIALGTDPASCVVRANGVQKTASTECVSSLGAYDAVGNVWEWVDASVHGNTFNGRTLPTDGYVTSVDADGVAITSGQQADDLYGKDYFWSRTEGIFGMIRGGFYGSGDDAGVYTINASVQTSFATQGVGFRCVEDVL